MRRYENPGKIPVLSLNWKSRRQTAHDQCCRRDVRRVGKPNLRRVAGNHRHHSSYRFCIDLEINRLPPSIKTALLAVCTIFPLRNSSCCLLAGAVSAVARSMYGSPTSYINTTSTGPQQQRAIGGDSAVPSPSSNGETDNVLLRQPFNTACK